MMRKAVFFIIALVLTMPVFSQIGGRRQDRNAGRASGRIPVETKEMIYFADGKLDEYTTFDWDSSFSHVDNQARFSASGAMLEQVEFAYNDEKGWVTTKITRDVESRLKNRVVYQYNPKGQLWRESLVDNKGKIVSSYEYAYDAKGNRTSRTIKNRAGDKLAETVYEYNADGKMITSKTSDFAESAISSTKYSYDAQGNLINQEVFNAEGKVTSVISAVWQDGHELKNEMTGSDGAVQLRVTNEYGAEGELIRKTVENFQGESTQIMQYEYTFRPARRQS
jgi:hypothetical protein